MAASSMVTAQPKEFEVAKVIPQQIEMPEVLPEEERELQVRPAYDLGVEHGFFLARGRRCSVPGDVIRNWNVLDFRAYKFGLERK